jgi:hypothetical protein
LRILTVDDVVKDFDAICDRVDRDGSTQPPFVATVAENLVDLGRHQKEFELRRSFAGGSRGNGFGLFLPLSPPDDLPGVATGCNHGAPQGLHPSAPTRT